MVLVHNFIPHHHHSSHNIDNQYCELEKGSQGNRDEFHQNRHFIQGSHICSVAHHQNRLHTFCSFNEDTVLTKWINLSNLFLPSTELFFSELAQNKQSFPDTYTSIRTQEPFCRDVQLRGPPQLS